MTRLLGALSSIPSLLFAATFSLPESPTIPILNTGDVYFIGNHIAIVVSTQADTLDYKLEWVLVDRTRIIGETYHGVGKVQNVQGLGRVALLPTSTLTRKAVRYLSENNIPRG